MKRILRRKTADYGKTLLLTVCLCIVQWAALNTRQFFLQASLAFFLSSVCALGGLRLVGLKTLGQALNLFVLYNLLVIGIRELTAQVQALAALQPMRLWRSVFYYDEPMIILIEWSAAFLCCVFAGIFGGGKAGPKFQDALPSFFLSIVRVFRIYYVFQLFYFLFLFRVTLGVSPKSTGVNLVPLRMVWAYFFGQNAGSYDTWAIFFGNIFLFVPMGFYFRWRRPQWGKLLWIAPVLISCGIEIFQYVTQLGQTDIDDVILNTAGFYLGMWIKTGLDILWRKNRPGQGDSLFGA